MENKIIELDKAKKKTTAKRYKLAAQISIELIRKGEGYKTHWFYSNDISEEDAHHILKRIYKKLLKEVQFIEYKEHDEYTAEFSLLYYEKSKKDIKYICNPPTISKEKLAEYLMVSISIYELKKAGAL